MICPNCKKEIPDHSKFCTYCGADLTSKSISEPSEPIERKTDPLTTAPVSQSQGSDLELKQKNPKPNKTLNKVLLIGIIVLLIAVAVLVTVLVMNRNQNQSSPAVSTVTESVSQTGGESAGSSQADEPIHQVSASRPYHWIDGGSGVAQYNEKGNRSYVTLRAEPRKDSPEIAKIPNGTEVSMDSEPIYDSNKNIHYVYVHVNDGTDRQGWMRLDFIDRY